MNKPPEYIDDSNFWRDFVTQEKLILGKKGNPPTESTAIRLNLEDLTPDEQVDESLLGC